MANDKDKTSGARTPQEDAEDAGSGRRGLFGLWNKLDDAMQSGRGGDRPVETSSRAVAPSSAVQDDIAIKRARPSGAVRMLLPEGCIIEGSLKSASDTEIAGRVQGDVTVQGRLLLGASGVIAGNVRAASCLIEGKVEGKVECSDDVELSRTGRLNADVSAGKRVNIAGQVLGNVNTPGVLRLATSAQVQGDMYARNLVMEEGATLNGQCIMRPQQPQNSGEKKG